MIIQTFSPDMFSKAIQDDSAAIGALMAIYAFQTQDEKDVRSTKYQNGVGFNGTDSTFCSSLCQQYRSKGRLTEKQLAAVKKLLHKYWKQVPEISPLPNGPSPAEVNSKDTAANTPFAELIRREGIVELTFPYDPDKVIRVKTFSGRKWNKENKKWTVPVSLFVTDALKEMGFGIGRKLSKWINDESAKKVEDKELVIPGLRANLYPYQKDGIQFLETKNGRAIIGDDMGLGKTIQALGWLQLRKKDVLPALVVCPASLKLNWAREALKFTDLEPVIINGKNDKKFTIIPGGNRKDIYIANYDIIHETYECPACKGKKKINGEKCPTCKGKGKIPCLDKTIKDLCVKTVIYDEAHYLKSDTSSRTVAAKELSSSCSHVIPLSGTPIVNRPIEFYSTINMVNPKLFTSWWQYTQRFCGRKRTPFGWDVNGATNKDELHKILSQTIMIRRLKKDVLKDLPSKVRVVVPLEIDLGKYHSILERIAAELEGQEAEHLTIIEKAKQLIASLKMDMALEWIENYIESGEKLVVFGEHSKILEQVQEKFKNNSVLVYGGTSQTERQAAVDKFQNDPDCKVFIGSKSAMEGLTLTAAHATAFLELWWVPAHHDQAEDRVHRIGQEADSVTAYYLLAAGTIEEDIVEMLDAKRRVVAAILDGKKVEDVNMISMLLKKITGKEV
jgi:SWI/SNF-related matrix-associated actin-dependent regulator 1 of chromatin subfamily A